METLKKKQGITLIALVVTITILLILAGVTINAVLGENGLITKAREAANETKRAEIIDNIQMDILAAYLGGSLTEEKLEEILTKYVRRRWNTKR